MAVISTDEVVTRVFLNARERVSIITYESDDDNEDLRQTGAIDIPPSDLGALIAALRLFAAK